MTASKHPHFLLCLTVSVILGLSFIAGKFIETRGVIGATISVYGDGKVYARPDIASISFGAQTGRLPTSRKAAEKLRDDMNGIIEAIRKEGIEEKDIITESLWMNPAYDWKNGEQVPKGYEANQNLRVKIRDLDKVGDVLAAATRAGANRVGGVQFTIDEPESLRAQARAKAIAEARANAKKLAKDLGVRLGKLRGFGEGGGPVPKPMYERAMSLDAIGKNGGGMPVPSGEQEVSISVTLTYEVK